MQYDFPGTDNTANYTTTPGVPRWQDVYEQAALGSAPGAVNTYRPASVKISPEYYRNPSEQYRSAVLNLALGPGNLPPTAAAARPDLTGFNQGMAEYGATTGDYDRALKLAGVSAANAAKDRAAQVAALDLQARAARGEMPSAAEIATKKAQADALAAQVAMAASARGGASAGVMAQRQAAQNVAAMQGQNIQDLAQLKAQEMATARQAYMQGATGLRGTEQAGQALGLQTGQLGLGRGAQALQAAGIQLQPALATAGYQQQTNLANLTAGMTQQQIDDARRLGLLGVAGQIDVNTMKALMGYQEDILDQNKALQQMIAGQQAPLYATEEQARTDRLSAGLQFGGAILGGFGKAFGGKE